MFVPHIGFIQNTSSHQYCTNSFFLSASLHKRKQGNWSFHSSVVFAEKEEQTGEMDFFQHQILPPTTR